MHINDFFACAIEQKRVTLAFVIQCSKFPLYYIVV